MVLLWSKALVLPYKSVLPEACINISKYSRNDQQYLIDMMILKV
jgi:hypothetical protein